MADEQPPVPPESGSPTPPAGEDQSQPLQATPQADPVDPQPPSGKRKLLRRIILGIIAFFLVAVGGLYFFFVSYLDPAKLKKQFEGIASEKLGVPVQVGDIQLKFPTIVMSDIRLGSESMPLQPSGSLGLVSVTPDIWEILGMNLVIENIYISSASFNLVRDSSGTIVLPRAQASPAATASAEAAPITPQALPLKLLELQGFEVRLDDRSTGKSHRLGITKGSLQKSAFGGTLPFELSGSLDESIQLNLTGKADSSGKILAQVSVDLPDPKLLEPYLPKGRAIPRDTRSISFKGNLVYDLSGSIEIKDLVLNVDPWLPASGEFRASSLSPLNAEGAFKVGPMEVGKVFELFGDLIPELPVTLSEGKLGAQVRLEIAGGKLASMSAVVSPKNLKGSHPLVSQPVVLSDAQVTFSAGVLNWENLSASTSGIRVESRKGSLAFEPRLEGSGDIDLDVSTAEAFKNLHKVLPAAAAGFKPSGAAKYKGAFRLLPGNFELAGQVSGKSLQFTPAAGIDPVLVEELSGKIDGLGLEKGRIVIEKTRVAILGNTVSLSGTLQNAKDPEIKLEASARVDLAQLQKALPIENELFKKKTRMGGRADLDAQIGGTVRKPAPKATIRLEGAFFSIPERDLDFQNLSGTVQGNLSSVRLEKLEGKTLGGTLSGSGTLTDFAKPQLQTNLKLEGGDLGLVRRLLLKNVPSFDQEVVFSGKADLGLALSGKAHQPDLKGTAKLAGAGFSHKALLRPLTGISGPASFDNRGLSVDGIQAAWGSSTIRIKGRIDDWSAFKLSFEYFLQPLDLTDISAFFMTGTGYQATGIGSGSGKVSGPIDRIVVSGVGKIPSGEFIAPVSKGGSVFRFPYTGLETPFTFTDGILTVTNMKAVVFGGSLSGSAKFFLKESPIRFSFDTKGTGVQTQEFLAKNTSMKNVLSGGVDLAFKAEGNTTGLNSLEGNSMLSMKSGRYQAPPVAAQIFQVLSANELASGTITGLNGNFLFKNGRMDSDDLLFKSGYGQIGYKGSVGLDTTLKGTAQLTLTRKACQGSQILSQLIGKQESLQIPVGVKGSLLSPSIDLKVEKLLQKAIEKTAGDLLKDAVLGKSGDQSASGTAGATAGKPGKISGKDIGKIIGGDLGKILGGLDGQTNATGTPPTAPSDAKAPPPIPATASGQAPLPTPGPTPAPAPVATPTKEVITPKSVGKELKKIGKDLKKIFKF